MGVQLKVKVMLELECSGFFRYRSPVQFLEEKLTYVDRQDGQLSTYVDGQEHYRNC